MKASLQTNLKRVSVLILLLTCVIAKRSKRLFIQLLLPFFDLFHKKSHCVLEKPGVRFQSFVTIYTFIGKLSIMEDWRFYLLHNKESLFWIYVVSSKIALIYPCQLMEYLTISNMIQTNASGWNYYCCPLLTILYHLRSCLQINIAEWLDLRDVLVPSEQRYLNHFSLSVATSASIMQCRRE